MTVNADVDGYAASQKLKKLDKMSFDQRQKFTAERKRKKKERLAILAKIETLKDKVCEECKVRAGREANGYHCDCPASVEMRDLGRRLAGDPEKSGPKRPMAMEDLFSHINADNITWEIYLDMKDEKIDDRVIMRALRWSSDRFYTWKKAKGEIAKKAKKTVKPKPAPKKRGRPKTDYVKGAPIKELTVDKYLAHKKDKRSDSWVKEKYGIANTSFARWKRLNELAVVRKTQEVTTVSIDEKEGVIMQKGEDATEESLKAENELLKDANNKQRDILQRLQQKLADAESALGQQAKQVDQEEYSKLVADFTDLEEENDRLKRMLERLKHTETMNVMLMEQRVYLQEQLDEVMV
ncbi:hypothetical protein H9649_07540 [Sporosarcina sp. Sa2YVA2]|uniref:Uncharacterized protein n=1 Tax=Sporosarcina quadrami TaxID=2762234 RepID=A0ABR8U8R5_9BACL|nr:hypothetical protein [Sporosarcina quadrami]MBD7984427.1 hypothetical protein [Sporosarcina quadrami]